jgi:thioredoxin reductase (NADPH)
MRYTLETSALGVFATEDFRNTPLHEIATAMGEGAIAVFSAGQYIDNLKK